MGVCSTQVGAPQVLLQDGKGRHEVAMLLAPATQHVLLPGQPRERRLWRTPAVVHGSCLILC